MAGDPWAQREYAAMLRAYDKGCESYRASYEEADVDANVEYGVEVGGGVEVWGLCSARDEVQGGGGAVASTRNGSRRLDSVYCKIRMSTTRPHLVTCNLPPGRSRTWLTPSTSDPPLTPRICTATATPTPRPRTPASPLSPRRCGVCNLFWDA